MHLEAPRDVLGPVREACIQWVLQKIVRHVGFEEKEVWWEPLRLVIETSEEKFWGSVTQDETTAGLVEQQGEAEEPPKQEKANKLSPMQAGSLAVVVSNDTWTRQRKYNLQMEDSPVCLVCQGTEREEPDTIHHRKFSCQGIENSRMI